MVNANPWADLGDIEDDIIKIKEKLKKIGDFNFMLINLYKNGNDYIGIIVMMKKI